METRTSQPTQNLPEYGNRRIKLPFRITLLLILVLITTVLSAVRFFTAIAWDRTLQNYMPSALDAYVAITGAIWTLAGGFVLWSILRGARYSRLALVVVAAAYAAWAWIDRLLIQPGAHPNWRFDLLVTVVLLVYTGAVTLDRRNRIFFTRESYDR